MSKARRCTESVYRRAAKLAFDCKSDDVASCWIVDVAASRGTAKDAGAVGLPPSNIKPYSEEREAYNEMFRPPYSMYDKWGNHWGEDRKSCRVLALCFAAAMAEAGDL